LATEKHHQYHSSRDTYPRHRAAWGQTWN
jgi:hypothetical protein